MSADSARPDHPWMDLALREARRAARRGEVPIGAIAVRDGEVVASAHNRTLLASDPTAHAEVVLLRRAARRLGAHRLPGLEVYVTLEPCLMCIGALVQARVATLVFGARDPKIGATRLMAWKKVRAGLNHRFDIRGGVAADEAAALLREFFASRRPRAR